MALERKSDWNSPTAPTSSIYQFRSSDWNAMIDHTSGYINVKEPPYNAVGDGVTDDTAAIQAAGTAAGPGGHILMPIGTYLFTAPIVPLTGQVWRGSANKNAALSAGGTRIMTVGGIFAFQILSPASAVEQLVFRDFSISGPGSGTAGSGGFKFQGASASGHPAVHGILVENVSVANVETAFSGADAAGRSGSWQISNVHFRRFETLQVKYGLWMASSNADYWLWDDGNFSVNAGGSGLYLERGGDIGIRNVTGYGANATDTAFITVNGGHGPLLVERSQAESIKWFWNAGPLNAGNQNDFSSVLIGNTINADLVLGNDNFILLGNQLASPVTLGLASGSDNSLIDLGNEWQGGATLTLNSNAGVTLRAGSNRGSRPPRSVSVATPPYSTPAGAIWQGSGAPNDSQGVNGDIYFRTDTPGTGNQRLYIRVSGSWSGIL